MNCNYCINTSKKASYIVTGINGPVGICKTCLDSTFLQKLYKNSWKSIQYIQGKQVNRYNLPLDHKYTIQSFDYLGSILDGGGTTCQNCNRLIVNTATVKNEEGKTYTVGCDCAETLSLTDISDFWKVKEQEALHQKLTGYIRKIKQEQAKGIIFTYELQGKTTYIYGQHGYWLYRFNSEIFNKYFKNLNLQLKSQGVILK